MNRVIEFRVWDKVNKAMIYPEIIGVGMENFAWAHSRSYLHNCTDWDSEKGFVADPIYMQFTGLTDKNGKKIFEGDIVLKPNGLAKQISSSDVGLDSSYSVYKKNEPEKYIIYNVGYAFTIGNEKDNKYCGILNNAINNMNINLEVIGNIYENPNLCNK